MIVLFVDNLFFYSGGQLVSCKASLAALRFYGFSWYCYDDVLSENKYDYDERQMCRRQAKILNVLNYLSDCLSYAFRLLKLRTS